MSLPTLNFPRVTYCTDPRCTESRRCWRAENEDFGNAPGENYGPGCIPASLTHERTYEQGIVEGERRATERIVEWLRAPGTSCDAEVLADIIERGDHRREEEK